MRRTGRLALVFSALAGLSLATVDAAQAQQCPFGGGCSPIYEIKIAFKESRNNGTTFTTTNYDGAILLAYPQGSNTIQLTGANFNFTNATATPNSLKVDFFKTVTGSGNALCGGANTLTIPTTYNGKTISGNATLVYTTANACNYRYEAAITVKANIGPENYQVDFTSPTTINYTIYHNDQVINSSGNLTTVLGPGDGIVTPPGLTVGIRNACGIGQRLDPNTYVTMGASVSGNACFSNAVQLRRGSATYFRFVSPTGNDAQHDSNDGRIDTADGSVFPDAANLTTVVTAASGAANSQTKATLNSGNTGSAKLVSRLGGPEITLTASGTSSGTVASPSATLYGSVLPASRSVQVDATATAFATIVNAGNANATGCTIIPPATFIGAFSYQTTDPATNALTGTPNTPVDLPVNTAKSFVFAMTPTAAAPSGDVLLTFSCGTSTAPVLTIPGVNTLLLAASDTPVADAIAVGLTPSNDGFARTGGVGGTGLFVIASANIGATASLTARARLSSASMPAEATVCQTNPSTGQCLTPAAATVTATIAQGQNTTWAAFVKANGAIAADPAINRVFFEFVDAGGTVRGSTSTAVTSVAAD